MHPLRSVLTTYASTKATDLGFLVVRLHDTNSHSFQWPFGHTVSKQADKQNTQRLAMAMRGRGEEAATKLRMSGSEWKAAVCVNGL